MRRRCNIYLKFALSAGVPRVRYGGDLLSVHDRKQLIFVWAIWLSILSDTKLFCQKQRTGFYVRHLSRRQLLRLYRWMLRTDAAVFFEQLGLWKQAFQVCIGYCRPVRAIVRELGIQRETPLYEVLFPLLADPCRSTTWLTHVNTCVTFPKRVNLEGNDSLVANAVSEYIDLEEELTRLDENSNYESDPLAIRVRRWVEKAWRSFDIDEAIPDSLHTTGATAEAKKGVSYDQKVASAVITQELVDVLWLCKWEPIPYLYGGLGDHLQGRLLLGRKQHPKEAFPSLYFADGDLPGDDGVCFFDTVPKNAEKRRSISLERTARSFGQKVVGAQLRRYMQSHEYFHVDLYNQDKSRDLCLRGSRGGRFASLDLSSASDRNRASLVHFVFQDNPLVHELLFKTRATHVSFHRVGWDKTIQLRKFAPMGSGTCFPPMCTIITAVIALAYEDLGIHDIHVVYGDDILVRSEAYDLVCQYLEALGFKVNAEKSFHNSLYIESCGCEAYDGGDITPLKVSQLFDTVIPVTNGKIRRSVEHYGGLCSLANRLYLYGYDNARRSICRALRAYYKHVLFSHNAELGVLTTMAELNPHLETKCENGIRYFRAYKTDNRQTSCSDINRYARWLESAEKRKLS